MKRPLMLIAQSPIFVLPSPVGRLEFVVCIMKEPGKPRGEFFFFVIVHSYRCFFSLHVGQISQQSDNATPSKPHLNPKDVHFS